MHTINLVIGDWSGDGHGYKDTYTISSNLQPGEILLAFKAASSLIGLNIEDLFDDIDRCYLTIEQLKILEKTGFPIKEIFDYAFHLKNPNMELSSNITISPRDYLDIYLHIVKLGNSKFEYTLLSGNSLCIGGYGLFQR